MTQEQITLELKFVRDVEKRGRFLRLLLSIDQFFNVLLWNGSQDQTISSHIHTRQASGKANWFDNSVCWMLKRIQSKHCLRSIGE